MPQVAMIWAEAANRVIGRDNIVPWRIPEDMEHFRRLTTGFPVLMGRRTWESLPDRFRPLPERRNLVLTAEPCRQFPGAETVTSIDEAITRAADAAQLWVIGGAAVYSAALPYASRAVVTQLRDAVEGDTFAPRLDGRFEVSGDSGWLISRAGPVFRIREFRVRGSGA